MDRALTVKNTNKKNGTEREWNDWKKNKRERNDLAVPHSGTI